VFTTATGGRLDPAVVHERFRFELTRAGLPMIRVHDLRHTAATLMLQSGVDLVVVSRILGHSTIAQTADTYLHVTSAMREGAAEKMAALFTVPQYGSR
jgi:integrase